MKKLTFVSLAVALLVSVIALAQDTTKPGDAKPDSIKAAAQEKQEQKPASPENFLIGQYEVADLFESFQKGFVDLLVSLGEFGGYFVQERADLVFREQHDPCDTPAGPLGILRTEWPQKNA